MDEALIRQLPFFAGLPNEEIRRLALSLRRFALGPGTVLFREGDPGDGLYLVIDGVLDVIKLLGTPDERPLGTRARGEYVGEMSLLNPDGQRTASVRARTEVTLLELGRADFDQLVRRVPSMAYDIARVLAVHLQEANEGTIRDLRAKNQELTAAYQALQAAQAQLIEKERLERELEVARDIQLSIVPREAPVVEGLMIGARMVPAHVVGGDFFDFIPFDPDTLGIVIGDVSGKGVPAALFMALTCSLIRAKVTRTAAPCDVLQAVNRHLLAMNGTSMFVTMVYGILQRSTGRFDYVRAGHELPIVVRPDGQLVELPHEMGHPLAFLSTPRLDQQTISLESGSTLLLYTDGVTDATARDGSFFGLEGLKAAVTQHRGSSDLCGDLLQQVMRHSTGAAQADDITLVTVRAL